jgi:hypothetical protein
VEDRRRVEASNSAHARFADLVKSETPPHHRLVVESINACCQFEAQKSRFLEIEPGLLLSIAAGVRDIKQVLIS